MPRLLIIKGPNVGVTYDLGDRTRIGRLGENEIQVPDLNVSRMHSEIIWENDAHVIYDRGSKNGILINGEATTEKALQPGDEIVIGGCTFLFDGDINIQNARFSNNSVYFLPGNPEVAGLAKSSVGTDNLSDDARIQIDQLSHIAKIFDGTPAPLPALAERICEGLQNYFNADHAVLFLRDTPEGELRPFEATPRDAPVCVNAWLINKVAQEKQPFTLTELHKAPISCGLEDPDPKPADIPQGSEYTPSNTPARRNRQLVNRKKDGEDIAVSMICAPLITEGTVNGLLQINRQQEEPFSLHDLALLQCMAGFASISVQAARATDAGGVSKPVNLEFEQRAAASRSLRMQEISNSARRSADGPGTVLITGEIGTGKETLARFLHQNCTHCDGPFVVVNCSAIASEQFELEVFGREKDSFQPDDQTVPGKVEQAMGGTLFLDEVGDLDLAMQPKLLRFLQDRAFYRVGATHAVEAEMKVIAATTLDLAAAVRAGKFREDLWYRLNVVPFHMPPLRERREDIGPLVDFFINRHALRLNRRVLGANDSTINMLQKYDWPGNIRELDNAVERAVLLCDSKILTNADFSNIEEARRRLNSQADLERKRDTKPLAEVERQHIIIALKKHNFNQARAAEALGLHRNTLRNKIIEYGIDIPK